MRRREEEWSHPFFCPLLILASYLLGSVSSAILVTRLWSGTDIRTLGNRNAGAANVARSVGLLPAALVSVVDFSKGALPVYAAHQPGLGDACALGGAVAAVIGHSYPFYFRFRGGKGLAASLGALLVFTPFETLLVLPVLGLVYLVITGSAVTGALVSLSLLIGLNLWRGRPLIVALAPLALLVAMGLCTIPQMLLDWRERADLEVTLEHIEDILEIEQYPILFTPALVVNEKVVCAGRVPKQEEVLGWYRAALDHAE